MGKQVRRGPVGSRSRAAAVPADQVPVVGGREPCPCGSGRRYKACHGRAAAAERPVAAPRPFAGFAGECDWVALREFVPAASAPLALRGEHAGESLTLATILPLAAPAVRRANGERLIALQVLATSGDANRDLADALTRVLDAEPGAQVPAEVPAADGVRLEELIDSSVPLTVTVHDDFEFWFANDAEPTAAERASLEQAAQLARPTARLASVEAAYWTRSHDRAYLRWVLPHDEEPLLDALARLHARRADTLGEETRFVGAFRVDGLVVPVWELPDNLKPDDIERPAAALAGRLGEALAATDRLTADERSARAGIVSRQLTLR
jgi:hypothetical protein